jgi:hypothetical protein
MGDIWVFKKQDERTNQRAGHTARSTEKIKALNFTPAGIFLKFKNDKVKKSSLQTDGCGSGVVCRAFVSYYTLSVPSEGRDCSDCHLNPAVIKIQKGEDEGK